MHYLAKATLLLNSLVAANSDQASGSASTRATQVPTTSSTINTSLQGGDAGIVGGTNAISGEFPFYVKFEGHILW